MCSYVSIYKSLAKKTGSAAKSIDSFEYSSGHGMGYIYMQVFHVPTTATQTLARINKLVIFVFCNRFVCDDETKKENLFSKYI